MIATISAATAPETFDERRYRRARRDCRTRQHLGTKKADMPALKALDCYTTLGTHAQITRENYRGYMGVVIAVKQRQHNAVLDFLAR